MNDLVFIKDNNALTSSKTIADKFERRHSDVLRAISNIDASKEFIERNFALVKNEQKGAIIEKEYTLTRDGFSFLVMGFTGSKAAKFKEDFIEAFNEMEKEIKSNLIPSSTTEIILLAAQQLHEQSKRLDKIESEVKQIQASKETNDGGYVAIMGYARLENRQIDVETWQES